MSGVIAHPWVAAALALGLAFALSFAIALFYTRLHRGSPSMRPFAQSLAVAGVVSSLVVLSIGDNIARGLGLVGAVTLVRFRTKLKDPRDLIFAFAALAAGVAAGAQAFFVAISGTAIFVGGMFAVSRPWFGRGAAVNAVLDRRTRTEPAAIEGDRLEEFQER